MNTLLVINHIHEPLSKEQEPYRWQNKTALQRVVSYAVELVSKDSIVLLASQPPTEPIGEIRTILRPDWTLGNLLRTLKDLSKDKETIIYLYGDCPFINLDITRKMMDNHKKYFADYTFSDGYPYGLTPEIFESRILEPLAHLLQDPSQEIQRDSIFSLLSKDINSFDLETELSPVDLRNLRLSLTTDTKRNRLLCKAIDREQPADIEGITALVQGKPEILRTLPAYLSVQISERCPHSCSFCPYPTFGDSILQSERFLPLESFARILSEGARFCWDVTVGVSLWGDPSFYPFFSELCTEVASYPEVQLLVETSGVGWKQDTIEQSKEILKDRIHWIVDLSTDQRELYERIRGPGFDQSRSVAEKLLRISPRTTFIQSVRMQDTEEGLEQFYRSWKAKTSNLVIQKYDWFCGSLPQRRVTDLSPLHRFPCWHLKRDLCVRLNGTVPVCREDITQSYSMGNLLQEPIEEIWQRMGDWYLQHTETKYPSLCEKCDEYYTYNF